MPDDSRVLALSRSTQRNDAIVVFPHAGGSPRFYTSWCRELPAGVDLYGVTYPGRDMLLDEPPPETLVDLASDCATEMEPIIQALGSVVMFGHSMGAYVAFEATRSLERSGIPVTALVALERRHRTSAPSKPGIALVTMTCFGTRANWTSAAGRCLRCPSCDGCFCPPSGTTIDWSKTYRAEPDPQLSCPMHIMYGESDPEVAGVAFGGMGRLYTSRLACAAFSRRPFLSCRPHSPDRRSHIRHPQSPLGHCPVRFGLDHHKARSLTIRARSMP